MCILKSTRSSSVCPIKLCYWIHRASQTDWIFLVKRVKDRNYNAVWTACKAFFNRGLTGNRLILSSLVKKVPEIHPKMLYFALKLHRKSTKIHQNACISLNASWMLADTGKLTCHIIVIIAFKEPEIFSSEPDSISLKSPRF